MSVLALDRAQYFEAAVAAAVIDENNLIRAAECPERAEQLVVKGPQVIPLVEKRDYN
jgi:hypothetical protein